MPSLKPITLTKKLLAKLPARAVDAHKGQFGHALIIGGDYGTAGAPLLSAEMALQAGAGMVSVATRPEHIAGILARRPELMCLGVQSANQLQSLLSKASVLMVGMGLGQSPWSHSLLSMTSSCDKPQVWDADALNMLAQQQVTVPKNSVLTPHLGEAARLLSTNIETIENNKAKAINELARQYQCTIVLKGKGTLIAEPDGEVFVCNLGHPAMAGAGLGDVLAGLIGALIAQHLLPFEAAKLAVWLHAKAGETLGEKGRGLLAGDLAIVIRQLLEEHCPCLA